MNKNQFRAARLQLGLSHSAMGEALSLRKTTIMAMETGIAPINETLPYNAKLKNRIGHIVSFAVAWMLFNGGAMVPWPRSEDADRLRAFRDFHQLANAELAALFDLSLREIEYVVSPTAGKSMSKAHLMALAWMRIFGSRDPFAFPMHPQYDHQAASTCPLRLDAAPVINLRPDL
jgi:DNA-binding XRE family transcriptional regulator